MTSSPLSDRRAARRLILVSGICAVLAFGATRTDSASESGAGAWLALDLFLLWRVWAPGGRLRGATW